TEREVTREHFAGIVYEVDGQIEAHRAEGRRDVTLIYIADLPGAHREAGLDVLPPMLRQEKQVDAAFKNDGAWGGHHPAQLSMATVPLSALPEATRAVWDTPCWDRGGEAVVVLGPTRPPGLPGGPRSPRRFYRLDEARRLTAAAAHFQLSKRKANADD